ncbi:MAG: DUF72 domain-containing protein [Deltaproteobacteria bacterium]|nr:DUF72 domain-containing protein [Deltaproteobacteria bacterium]
MSRPPEGQQSLFAPPAPAKPAQPEGFDFAAAERIPQNLRFGTSSWVYEGWKGQVYRESYGSAKAFRQESLAEYARWPWFGAVGLDSSFYAPPAPATLDRMARQLPPGMLWVAKVWEHITIPRFPNHPRYGDRAGALNPDFLNAEVFAREVLPPFDRDGVREHCGPFLFEFQTLPPRVLPHLARVLERMDAFFGALPSRFRYAVELRTPELLIPEWFELLRRHRVAHCFNSWHRMPPLHHQLHVARSAGGDCGDVRLLRLLTVPGMEYGASVERFAPFDRLLDQADEVREAAVEIALEGLAAGAQTIVLVNNRLEGNSPATIDALGRAILDALAE